MLRNCDFKANLKFSYLKTRKVWDSIYFPQTPQLIQKFESTNQYIFIHRYYSSCLFRANYVSFIDAEECLNDQIYSAYRKLLFQVHFITFPFKSSFILFSLCLDDKKQTSTKTKYVGFLLHSQFCAMPNFYFA